MKVELVGYESQALMSSVKGKMGNIAAIVNHPTHPVHTATVTNGKHALQERFKIYFILICTKNAFQSVVILSISFLLQLLVSYGFHSHCYCF